MFNNSALDVFIGLLAIFLLYSLFASIIMEIIAKRLGLRQNNTFKAISKLLDDSDYGMKINVQIKGKPLTSLFYAHPNIRNLGDNWINKKPSSITPEMFSDTLIQLLRGEQFNGAQNQIDMIKANLKVTDTAEKGKLTLPSWFKASSFEPAKGKKDNGVDLDYIKIDVRTLYQFEQFLIDAGADIELFRKKLISWYNEMMDRAEGWYIRKTRGWLFAIGLILAIVLNVDAIHIGQLLARDKTMRDNMVNFASRLEKNDVLKASASKGSDPEKAIAQTFSEINKSYGESQNILGQGLQFQNDIGLDNSNHWGLGWLITGFAISLGAPFWFDLLGKLMAIRQGGSSSSTEKQKKSDAEGTSNQPIG